MGDLKNPKWMYLKALLFLFGILIAAGGLIAQNPTWRTFLFISILVWFSSRLYYFMFYVIEKYVDKDYKFSSVYSFIVYIIKRR